MTTATGNEVSMAFQVPGNRLVPGLARLKFKLNQAMRRKQIPGYRFDRPMWRCVGNGRWMAYVVFCDMDTAMLGQLAAGGP